MKFIKSLITAAIGTLATLMVAMMLMTGAAWAKKVAQGPAPEIQPTLEIRNGLVYRRLP